MKRININQLEMEEASNKFRYFAIIDSILFVSGEPLKLKYIASIIECSVEYTKELLEELVIRYTAKERGIKLINMNDEYQFITKAENSSYVQKLLKTNSRQALSQAALETLSIIAYKQPITRIDVDEIRGVKSDRAILNLQQRNIIKECGRLEAPGRPILYATTDEFLKYFDIHNLNELPNMLEIENQLNDEQNLAEDLEAENKE